MDPFSTYTEEGATWTDDIDGSGVVTDIGGDTIDTSQFGTFQITYDYTDAAGNAATTVIRTVVIARSQESIPVGYYLALDKNTNDLMKPLGGGVSRVKDARFVVQQVKSKLRTWLGEWFLDDTVGWVNEQDFIKNYDASDLERRAREIILNTDGVKSIESINTNYSQRKVTLRFKANTIYGTIDLTVPWGAINGRNN